MPTIHRYATGTVARAYLRCGCGLAVTLVPLLLLEPSPWLSVLLFALAALFLSYLASSIALHTARITLDDQGIHCLGLFSRSIDWNSLSAFELNYYTTRADGSSGWMELILRGGRQLIRIRSELTGFRQITARVASEAAQRSLVIDGRSLGHLSVLGISQGHTHAAPTGDAP